MKDFYEWGAGLGRKVSEVNVRLLDAIRSDQEDLFTMARYTIEAGGKRFRPLLTILAYQISTDSDYRNILDLAAGYELIHTASLLHDDIIDKSPTRRGKPTLNSIYGVDNSIVVGDYLFAKAYELGSRYGPAVSKIMADASSRLAEGQILESINLGNVELSEEVYLEIISNKTAKFFEACALGATVASGSSKEISDSLRNFSYNLGMAFQVTDDILDVIGDPQKMGKPVFTDIKHSTITVPFIHALRNSGKEERNELLRLMENPSDHDNDKRIKEIIVNTNSLDYSFSLARSFTEMALDSIKETRRTPDLDLLIELAMMVVQRIQEI